MFSKILEVARLLDRLIHARHGSTLIASSPFPTIVSGLSSALTRTNGLLRVQDNISRHHHIIRSLSFILDRSVPILESHLATLGKFSNKSRHGHLIDIIRRYKRSRKLKTICNSVKFITVDLLHISALLEMDPLTRPDESLFDSLGPEHHAAPCNDEQSAGVRPTFFSEQLMELPISDEHAHALDVLPVAELPGNCMSAAEPRVSVQLSAEDQPMTLPSNIRASHNYITAGHLRYMENGTNLGYDLSDGEFPWMYSPSRSVLTSPPPSYASLFNEGPTGNDNAPHDGPSMVDTDTMTRAEAYEPSTDPITAACRDIMRTHFQSPSATLFEDYAHYRKSVLASHCYLWYLNFRYLSFVLQPDLSCQVFLVTLGTYQAETFENTIALLYLFEDCIVFGRSPFGLDLPDPTVSCASNSVDEDVQKYLDKGLEILEDLTLRFSNLISADKEGKKALIIGTEMKTQHANSNRGHDPTSPSNARMHYELKFETTCQRREVFRALSPWLKQKDNHPSLRHRRHSAFSCDTESANYRHACAHRQHQHSRCKYDHEHEHEHGRPTNGNELLNGEPFSNGRKRYDWNALTPRSASYDCSAPHKTATSQRHEFGNPHFHFALSSRSTETEILNGHASSRYLARVWLDE